MRQTFAPKTDRHERGWGGRSRTTHVPLLSAGEMHRGYFQVPAAAVTWKEHSNQIHGLNQHVRNKVREWVSWKARLGYRMVGAPTVFAPIPTPSAHGEESDGEMRIYVAAKFVRETPMKMPLDLFLHKRDQAHRYGESLEEAHIATPLVQPVAHIDGDGGGDSMSEAEQRRNQLGIRRELVVEDNTVTGANVIYETPPDGRQDRDLETS